MMVDFVGPLIVVNDERLSREFYEKVLSQKIKFDIGACQQFESGLTLQRKTSMTEVLGIPQADISFKSNSHVLYFETADFDAFVNKLKSYPIKYMQEVVEYEWGQRAISFYDPDGHIIDVSEEMKSVFERFLTDGLTVPEIAVRTEHPLDFVESTGSSLKAK